MAHVRSKRTLRKASLSSPEFQLPQLVTAHTYADLFDDQPPWPWHATTADKNLRNLPAALDLPALKRLPESQRYPPALGTTIVPVLIAER